MKIAISGSRHHDIPPSSVAGYINPGVSILVGDCPTGVDRCVARYCAERGAPAIIYYGRDNVPWPSKGPERNGRMIADADWLIAFWDGRVDRCGTFDAIKQAVAKGIKVTIQPVGRP